MNTTLTVDIEYDPRLTDPEGLAVAMDRLLKTALSTPGIMEDYGNPHVNEFFVAETPPGDEQGSAGPELCSCQLRIDGPAFRNQRKFLLRLADAVQRGREIRAAEGDFNLLEGLLNLTDEIADEAHDRYGMDTIICECEQPGLFFSGVPGILASVENGKLVPGATVERCDSCQRYPSDEAAYDKLRELGYA